MPHRAIGEEAANAGAHDDSSPQRCSAAHHVDCTAASKVNDPRPEQVVGGVGSGPATQVEVWGKGARKGCEQPEQWGDMNRQSCPAGLF